MIRVTSLLTLLLILTACGSAGSARPDSGASATGGPTPTRAAAALLTPQPGFEPVEFPQDEAPHDKLTEWWYYTGHMFTESGDRYGFQLVFFQSERAEFPALYAAHFAITDNQRDRFAYDQKSGGNADQQPDQGFSLELDNWAISGANGADHLRAAMDGYSIDLTLNATKPPVLHNERGYVEFGAAGGSYYYSRTRMGLTGTLTTGGQERSVTGDAWMDHQWGNFVSLIGGGWDWFAVQLDDNRELTISLIRNFNDEAVMSYGTLVNPDGSTEHLDAGDLRVASTGSWTSKQTGITYPAGWTVSLPARGWDLTLSPTLPDQELMTTATTGVTYWEGEVTVDGSLADHPIGGLGYVELTGYGDPPPSPSE